MQHHAVAVAPVAAYQSPDIFIVANNYPPANGSAALLAQQGSSVYGYQQAASAYFVSPTEVFRQAAELSKAASLTAQIGVNGYNQMAQTQLTLQAQIAEPLVKGQAAAQVLTAAGLSQSSLTQPQSLALQITRGPDGQWKVAQADPAQVNAEIRAEINSGQAASTPAAPNPNQPVTGSSILGQKCAKCHGLSLAEPKKGVFIDSGHNLDCKTAWTALRLVKEGKMPPDGTLTPEEKGLVLEELDKLVKFE